MICSVIFGPYDMVHTVSYEFDHTASSLQVTFDSNLNENTSNESWGFSK